MKNLLLCISLFSSAYLFCQETYEELYTAKKSAYHVTTDVTGDRVFIGTQKGDIVQINNTEETIALFSSSKELILAQAVSPENKFMMTGYASGKLELWDLANLAGPIKQFPYHEKAITSILYNGNGNILIVGAADGEISVWDVHRAQLLKVLKGHSNSISGISLHHSESKLASSSYDGTVKIWDLSDFSLTKTLDMKGGKVRSVAYSYDGERLAVGLSNKTIRILNAENYSSEFLFMGHRDVVYQVGFTYDDHYLISGSQDNTVRIWDTKTGQTVKSFNELANFVSFKLSPNAKSLYIADMTPVLKVWDISGMHFKESGKVIVRNVEVPIMRGEKEVFKVNRNAPMIGLIGTYKPDKIFETEDSEVLINGNLVSVNKLFKLEINNQEINVNNYKFSYAMKLAIGKTTIKIKAIDIYNNETINEFVIHRSPKVKGKIDASGREGSDYALVIATDEFNEFNDLTNPVYDGRTIAKNIEDKFGYHVDTLFNPTKTEIYKKLREYNKRVFSDDDQLFIFFAGHGEFDDVFSEGYLVAKDSKADDEVKETYISHSNLRTIIDHIPCKHIFVTMDVCFGGTFDPQVAKEGGVASSTNHFIATKLLYRTRLYLTSGGKKYVPDGREGQHSPFATEFLNALNSNGNKDNILTTSEITQYVEHLQPKPQNGAFGDNELGSDFLFIYRL
jgi:WD40 repeat protein